MAGNLAQRLMQMKEDLDQAKLDRASTEAILKQNMQKLKEDFGCKSVDQAKAKLEQLKKQLEKLEIQLEQATTDLEEDYDW